MATDPNQLEQNLIADLTKLAAEIAKLAESTTYVSNEAAGVSTMLYMRLWSNYGAYRFLRQSGYRLESGLVFRAALEATLCLVANAKSSGAFYAMLVADLLVSLKSMVKQFRSVNETSLVKETEALIRGLANRAEQGSGSLNWRRLSEIGDQPFYYEMHKHLSSTVAHVTAISIMRGVTDEDGSMSDRHNQLEAIEGPRHPMIMAGAMIIALNAHISVANWPQFEGRLAELADRLNLLSTDWVD